MSFIIKTNNTITIIPSTTPYNPNSLFPNAVNAHQLMNTPHTSAYKLHPYVARRLRNIRWLGNIFLSHLQPNHVGSNAFITEYSYTKSTETSRVACRRSSRQLKGSAFSSSKTVASFYSLPALIRNSNPFLKMEAQRVLPHWWSRSGGVAFFTTQVSVTYVQKLFSNESGTPVKNSTPAAFNPSTNLSSSLLRNLANLFSSHSSNFSITSQCPPRAPPTR